MTLTVVVGSSGSGKTTFLEDVHKINNSVYIRQYHTLRPYIPVRKIPSFDPSKLPFWKLYSDKVLDATDGAKNASYNPNIKIGGTMAGEFHAGLSGGQRKMMLFELVDQRIAASSDLLVCLDEPFAGVTDDFVPFIVERLNEMRKSHNILLVTNDHVRTLTKMADSTITVSAIDRSKISVNGETYDRDIALHAVSSGKRYSHTARHEDLWFFFDTEVLSNPQIGAVVGFTIFTMLLTLLTFWDSKPGSEALVIVALGIVAFFAIQPYLISLPDWRNTMIEEAEALMHSSVQTNLALKSALVLAFIVGISGASFGMLNACIHTLSDAKYWVFMLMDSASLTLPFICFGLYSKLPLQVVQIVASLPFLLMIFFSTTFSPGAGVAGVKALRFLFARFYFWCALPLPPGYMEGCPSDEALIPYAVLTGCLGMLLFLAYQLIKCTLGTRRKTAAAKGKRAYAAGTSEFQQLQKELYGEAPRLATEDRVDATPSTAVQLVAERA